MNCFRLVSSVTRFTYAHTHRYGRITGINEESEFCNQLNRSVKSSCTPSCYPSTRPTVRFNRRTAQVDGEAATVPSEASHLWAVVAPSTMGFQLKVRTSRRGMPEQIPVVAGTSRMVAKGSVDGEVCGGILDEVVVSEDRSGRVK